MECDQMSFIFQHSLPSSPHTSSITVTVLGFHWSKKWSTADMMSSNELFSSPLKPLTLTYLSLGNLKFNFCWQLEGNLTFFCWMKSLSFVFFICVCMYNDIDVNNYSCYLMPCVYDSFLCVYLTFLQVCLQVSHLSCFRFMCLENQCSDIWCF